jgi:hypothetical protein
MARQPWAYWAPLLLRFTAKHPIDIAHCLHVQAKQ